MRVHTLDLRNKLKATITQISLYYQFISTLIQLISKAPKLQVREEGGKNTHCSPVLSHCPLTAASNACVRACVHALLQPRSLSPSPFSPRFLPPVTDG